MQEYFLLSPMGGQTILLKLATTQTRRQFRCFEAQV